jgi:alcohol oxidase
VGTLAFGFPELKFYLCSLLDAGIKWRPSLSELAELGPEFKEYWDRYFANAPDKPVLWLGFFSTFVL